MKKIRVFSIFAILLLTAVNLGFAQSKITEEQKKEMQALAESYIGQLNLTDAQKEEFQALNLKYAEKLMELKESSGAKFSKMKKAKAIRSDKNAEVKALLNDEQYATYQSFQKEMRDKMKEIMNK